MTNLKIDTKERLTKRTVSILLILFMILQLAPLNTFARDVIEDGDFRAWANNVPKQNRMDVEWKTPDDGNDYGYLYYQRQYDPLLPEENQQVFNTRSTKYNKPLKILNIYPNSASYDLLEGWMHGVAGQGDVYGLLSITRVAQSSFNTNPDSYLRDAEGHYIYDVIAIGFADLNNSVTVNAAARTALEAYLKTGRGVLFGHDTLVDNAGAAYITSTLDVLGSSGLTWQYGTLRHYAGIIADNSIARQATGSSSGTSNRALVVKDGFLLKYPNVIKPGQLLTVGTTHVNGSRAKGDIWVQFAANNSSSGALTGDSIVVYDDGEGEGSGVYLSNYYLTTYKNTAFIQTGHTVGATVPKDERNIIANTFFYLAQLTYDTKLEDNSAIDLAAPGQPQIYLPDLESDQSSIGQYSVRITAEDFGTTYQGYVEALDQNDLNATRLKSDVFEETVTSGIRGYVIVKNFTEDYEPAFATNDDGSIDIANTAGYVAHEDDKNGIPYFPNSSDTGYLHVRAVDWAGNVGPVNHFNLYDLRPSFTINIVGKTKIGGEELTLYTIPQKLRITDDDYSFDPVKLYGYQISEDQASDNRLDSNNEVFISPSGIGAAIADVYADSALSDEEKKVRVKELTTYVVWYDYNMTAVTIKAMYKGTNTPVEKFTQIQVPAEKGKPFSYLPPNITGFNYESATPENGRIESVQANDEIIFYYTKLAAEKGLIINAKDENGTPLGTVFRAIEKGVKPNISAANAPGAGELPILSNYTFAEVENPGDDTPYDGVHDIIIHCVYKKNTAKITLQAYNTVTGDEILDLSGNPITHVIEGKPVLENYDYSPDIGELTAKTPTGYVIAAQGGTLLFVDANESKNTAKVWYTPPRNGIPVEMYVGSQTGELLYRYTLPATEGETITLGADQYPMIPGYEVNENASTLTATQGSAANGKIIIVLNDVRLTVTLKYTKEGTLDDTLTDSTTHRVVRGTKNYKIFPLLLRNYVLKSYVLDGETYTAGLDVIIMDVVDVDKTVTLNYVDMNMSIDETSAIAKLICFEDLNGNSTYDDGEEIDIRLVGGLTAGQNYDPEVPDMSTMGYMQGTADPSNPSVLAAGENVYYFNYSKDLTKWSKVSVRAVYGDGTAVPAPYYTLPADVLALKGSSYTAVAPVVTWHALNDSVTKTLTVTQNETIEFTYAPVQQNIEVRAVDDEGKIIMIKRHNETVGSSQTYDAVTEFGMIPGWVLNDDSSKTLTTVSTNPQQNIVEFEYKRNARDITILLLDQNDEEITTLTKAITDVGIGEVAKVYAPHISGYTLDASRSVAINSFEMPSGAGDYVVTFYYEQTIDNADVTIIGKAGAVELYRYVVTGVIGETRTIKGIPVAYHTAPSTSQSATFGTTTQLVFEYISNFTTVTIKAQDKNGDPIPGNLDKKYDVLLGNGFVAYAPIIDGWVISDDKYEVTNTIEGDDVITFTYKRAEGLLLIQAVDEVGNVLKVVGKDLPHGTHTINASELGGITGWLLDDESEKEVTAPGNSQVTFKYKKDTVKITVQGVKDGSGDVLFSEDYTVQKGTQFTGHMIFVPGWSLKEAEDIAKTILVTGDATIPFTYVQSMANVRILHETTDGRILMIENDTALALSPYTASAKTFAGYKLAEGQTPTQNGIISESGESIITFKYDANTAEITVKLVNAGGGEIDSYTVIAQLDLPTTIYAPHLPGYALAGSDRQVITPVSGGTNEVTFRYETIGKTGKGALTVTVLDAATSKAISGATLKVTYNGETSAYQTYNNGGVIITDAGYGDYVLETSCTGYYTTSATVSLSEEDRSQSVIITLSKIRGGGGGGGTTYAVAYHPNGGEGVTYTASGLSSGQSHTVLDVNAAAIRFDYGGNTFISWNTQADGGGANYKSGDKIIVNGNTNLYAKWDVTTPEPDVPIGPLETAEHIVYVHGYPDGAFRADSAITRAEAAAIFFRLTTDTNKNAWQANRFGDVDSGAWYAQAVNFLASKGILDGYTNGTFQPERLITRAEFTAISSRFSSLEASKSNRFSDIPSHHWAIDDIYSAYAKGWINGYEDGTFRPEQSITRAEVVKIVNAMLNRLPKALPEWAQNPYRDITTSHWAYIYIMEASTGHDYDRDSSGAETWNAK